MNRRMLGGLLGAAAAVTVLVAPTATASDVPCGSPAVPAVTATVTHAAGEATIPAVTHLEWLWTREVVVQQLQYELLTAGYRAVEWTRESGIITGPDGELISSKESILLPKGVLPKGKGWELTGESFWVKDPGAKVWSVTPPTGSNWEPTGRTRVISRDTETTTETSALPPAGEGWVKVPGSEIVVVDVPEDVVTNEEPWTEEVVVSPALPAGEPCPTATPEETHEPTTAPATTQSDPTTTPTVLGVERQAPVAQAPAAVPTAVDAGLTAPTTDGSAVAGLLGGLAVALVLGGTAVGVAGLGRPARKH